MSYFFTWGSWLQEIARVVTDFDLLILQFRFELIGIFKAWNADRLIFVHVFFEQFAIHLFFEFPLLLFFSLRVYFVLLFWFLVEFVDEFFFVHFPLVEVGCCSGLHVLFRWFLLVGSIFAAFALYVVPKEGHRASRLFAVVEQYSLFTHSIIINYKRTQRILPVCLL